MNVSGWAALSLSCLALAACGAHRDAPVVHGSDPSHRARIYNSPNDYAPPRRTAARPAQEGAPRAMQASTTDVERANLRPVTAVYLDEPGEVETLSKPVRQDARGANGVIAVRPGDTVYAIGRRYNVPPQAIIAENNLRAPYRLEIGQTLRLPNGAASSAAGASPARNVAARDQYYRVRQGDTLYSLSLSSGVDMNTIAQANGLTPPYALSVGQQLLLPQARADGPVRTAARDEPEPLSPQRRTKNVADLARTVSYAPPPKPDPEILFDWPVRGALVATYGVAEGGRRNDGVNIAAPAGTPVRAAAAGEVVYRGAELDGFGNLLLIKHSDDFVTAYAHNDAMLVDKGDLVRKGQVIAKVGQTGAVTTPQLHFEIRQRLKSVDPIALLGPQ